MWTDLKRSNKMRVLSFHLRAKVIIVTARRVSQRAVLKSRCSELVNAMTLRSRLQPKKGLRNVSSSLSWKRDKTRFYLVVFPGRGHGELRYIPP